MSKPKLEKTVKIPTELIEKLLTPSETRMLKNRWQILQLLEEGLSIRKIAEQVKVGTDTVVRVARMMESGALKQSLSRAKLRDSGSSTYWIFGKNE